MDESAVNAGEARAHLADFNALEDAADELLADLFIERDAGRDAGAT